MISNEFEKELLTHAQNVKNAINPTFEYEKGEVKNMKKYGKFTKKAVVIAAAACLTLTSVFAAIHYLSPSEVADELGKNEVGKYFEESASLCETVTDGVYKATLLGVTFGKNLDRFDDEGDRLNADSTYAVIAIEKADGSEITYEDSVTVTPLIQGLEPWKYNIFTMNGGYCEKIIDGVRYRIIDCDSIECFSDRKLYIAVYEGMLPSSDKFIIDAESGEISAVAQYDGTNILFEFELDASKADTQKAEQLIDEINSQMKW